MGVGHLGGHVEPEVLVIVHITVPQPDEQTAPLDEGLFKQHRLQGWVQLFPYLGGRRGRGGEGEGERERGRGRGGEGEGERERGRGRGGEGEGNVSQQ